ncbi:DUF6934 family protein [Ohtaekwangia sp.]|uniref:DUF6934 family protein n=1 Tax=Ohtaekwangia sp. TaxID=2066019 RepID=UPI002F951D27
MHLDRYSFITERNHINYVFTSEGQNGKIRKAIVFILIDPKGKIYNLAFGDYNEETDQIDDLSISNNQDRDKILATVGAAVLDFSQKHPLATIIAIGSTASRTRLYRMGITKYLDEISDTFEIEGFINKWQPFKKGCNYQAFSVKRKNV